MTSKTELENRIREALTCLEEGRDCLWDMDEEMQAEVNYIISVLQGGKDRFAQ